MDALLNNIIYPLSFNELFSAWKRLPQAVLFAGGTDLIGRQGNNIINLPKVVLCLDKLKDLHRITRTEHYLEIGSMITLNRLSRLGKIVPEILSRCIDNIGGIQLRNLATIGGNICSTSRLYYMPAVLIAFDAQYELRSAGTTRWISASRFHSAEEHNSLKKHELLTRIRLPLHQWDYSFYKKFPTENLNNNEVLVFLVKTQKNILTDISVVYKANAIFRDKASEDFLNGNTLPLNRKIAVEFIENWKEFLADKVEASEFSKNAILNNIEENLFFLST